MAIASKKKNSFKTKSRKHFNKSRKNTMKNRKTKGGGGN
jgi:hypothetical protein